MSAASDLHAALAAELEPTGCLVGYGTGRPLTQYPVPPAVWLSFPEAGDTYSAPCGTRELAKARRLVDRQMSLVVRVEGSNPAPGATYGDHCDFVLALVDAVIRALHRWARGIDAGYSIGRSGFVDPGTESPAGMAYTLALTIPEHVKDAAPPTGVADDWETTFAVETPPT